MSATPASAATAKTSENPSSICGGWFHRSSIHPKSSAAPTMHTDSSRARTPQKRPALSAGSRSAIQLSHGAVLACPSISLTPSTAISTTGHHARPSGHTHGSSAGTSHSSRCVIATTAQKVFRRSSRSTKNADGNCANSASCRTAPITPS